jgi:hypothetical protein
VRSSCDRSSGQTVLGTTRQASTARRALAEEGPAGRRRATERARSNVSGGQRTRSARQSSSREADREGFQNLGSAAGGCAVVTLGAWADAPLFRLPRVLGDLAVVGRASAKHVGEGRRTARLTASACCSSSATATPAGAAGGSCLPRSADADPPLARAAGVDRDAADAGALASRAGAAELGAAAGEVGASRRWSVACVSLCCAWHGRIRAGVTRGSLASF